VCVCSSDPYYMTPLAKVDGVIRERKLAVQGIFTWIPEYLVQHLYLLAVSHCAIVSRTHDTSFSKWNNCSNILPITLQNLNLVAKLFSSYKLKDSSLSNETDVMLFTIP